MREMAAKRGGEIHGKSYNNGCMARSDVVHKRPDGPPQRSTLAMSDASTLSSGGEKDPRVRLAAERTLLAWLRTGLAMMGFGFVVARFGLFLHELDVQRQQQPHTPGWSLEIGTALVLL